MEQDSPAQSRAFAWVSVGTQLVQQHEALCRGSIDDLYDVPYVPAKGGKGLLDALLITDVGIHAVKNRNTAFRLSWNGQAGLRHQTQKSYRLEGHRLATSIGPGNDQDGEVPANLD